MSEDRGYFGGLKYYALFLAQALVVCAAAPSSSLAFGLSNDLILYGTGTWDAATLGNHRVVLKVDQKADAVWARIRWRRRDTDPQKKNLILIEESTGQRVTNVFRVAVSNACGDIVFQALNAGTYYLYYLPCISRGKNYP